MRAAVFLILLIASGLALATHLIGDSYLLPHLAEPDDEVVRQVWVMEERHDAPGAERSLVKYPQLLSKLTIAAGKLTGAPETRPAAERAPLADHLRAAASYHLRVRRMSSFLSIFMIPAVYFIVRIFMSRGWSALAAVFVSSSLLFIWCTPQGRPHAAAAAFAACATAAAAHAVERRSLLLLTIGGAFAGCAAGTLQSGIIAFLPVCAAAGYFIFTNTAGGWKRAWIAFLPAVPILYITYPFLFDTVWADDDSPSSMPGSTAVSAHSYDLSMFNGLGFPRSLLSLLSFDPELAVLGVAGGLLALKELYIRGKASFSGNPAVTILLAYALPYFCAIGLWQNSRDRFLLPLLPYAAGLAVFTIYTLFERFKIATWARIIIIAALVAFPATIQIKMAYLRTRADTLEQAAAWIEENVADGQSVLLTPRLNLPLLQTRASIETVAAEHDKEYFIVGCPSWFRYQMDTPPSAIDGREFLLKWPKMSFARSSMKRGVPKRLDELPAWVGDYALIRTTYAPPGSVFEGLYSMLRRPGKLQKQFTPIPNDGDETPTSLLYHETFNEFYRFLRPLIVLRATSIGPALEIYKLK